MPYGHISISGTSAAGNLSMSTHHCCLGGPGVTVQIDERLFHHKPKYHRGRPAAQEVWVFGMLDTSQSPALVVMMTVPDRSVQTLLPIMQRHLRNGTIVHSDQWRAYNRVQQLPSVAQHGTANYSLSFVDPTTGVHTQNIESYILESGENKVQADEGGSRVNPTWMSSCGGSGTVQVLTLAIFQRHSSSASAFVYPFRILAAYQRVGRLSM